MDEEYLKKQLAEAKDCVEYAMLGLDDDSNVYFYLRIVHNNIHNVLFASDNEGQKKCLRKECKGIYSIPALDGGWFCSMCGHKI